jgi:hypothetical protein
MEIVVHESEDPVVASRYLDREGKVVEFIGGVWCDPLTGTQAQPVRRQVIRQSAWTDDLYIGDEVGK